jgi:hypothetical protein
MRCACAHGLPVCAAFGRQIGQVGPNFASFVAARAAAAKIFYLIDRKPQIDGGSNDGVKLDPSTVRFHWMGGGCVGKGAVRA